MPTSEDFAALARSSPWLWDTLRFTLHWSNSQDVRAWLRRPGELRVEALATGELLELSRGGFQVPHPMHTLSRPSQPTPASAARLTSTVTFFASEDPAPVELTNAVPGLEVLSRDEDRARRGRLPEPTVRPDGLVAVRPAGSTFGEFDAPMWQNYYWVALMDPLELADGRDEGGHADGAGTVMHDVTETEHHGRAAWQATVTPTDAYEPRCTCCSLLRSRRIDVAEYGDRPGAVLDQYPSGYRVRLDRQTGVCVLVEPIDALPESTGHDLTIHAVDEQMPDELFSW